MNSKQTARFIFLSLLLSCSFSAFGMWQAILNCTGINDFKQGFNAEERAAREPARRENQPEPPQPPVENNVVPPAREPQEELEINEGDNQEEQEEFQMQAGGNQEELEDPAAVPGQQAVPENIDVQESVQKQAESNADQAQLQPNNPDSTANANGNNPDPAAPEKQESVALQPNKLTFRRTLLVSGLISLSALCVYFLWQEYGDMIMPRKKEVSKKNSKEILEQEKVSDKKETASVV